MKKKKKKREVDVGVEEFPSLKNTVHATISVLPILTSSHL